MIWIRFKRFMMKLARVGVWFGFAFALEGSFEEALQASPSPIWSSVFGFPMLHHYLIGFIVLAVSLLILQFGMDVQNVKDPLEALENVEVGDQFFFEYGAIQVTGEITNIKKDGKTS